jgi:hypothetical protein
MLDSSDERNPSRYGSSMDTDRISISNEDRFIIPDDKKGKLRSRIDLRYINNICILKPNIFILFLIFLLISLVSNSVALPSGTINPGDLLLPNGQHYTGWANYYTQGDYTGCQAGDVTVSNWGFTATSCAGCSEGGTGSGTLHVDVTPTASTRYNVFLIFNVNGNPYRVLVSPILTATQSISVPVTWPCTGQSSVTIGGPGTTCGTNSPIVKYEQNDVRGGPLQKCDPFTGVCGKVSDNDANSYEWSDIVNAGSKCSCLGTRSLTLFSSTASYTQLCAANADGTKTISFTQTVTGGSSPYYYSWDWDNDGTFESGESTSPTAIHDFAPGTYTVGYEVRGNGGCTYKRTVPITVYAPLSTAVAYTQPCTMTGSMKTISFTQTVTGGISPYHYSWDWNNDGTFESGESTSPTVTHDFAPGTYTIGYQVRDSTTTTSCTYIGTVSITVYATLSATMGYTQPCALTGGMKAVLFTSTPTGGSSGYTYSWDWENDGTYEITDSASNTATQNFAPGTSTVGWRVKDSAGCTYTETTSVTVYGGLSATVDYTQPCTLTGGMKAVLFTSTPTGGSSGYTYSWDWENDGTYEITDSASNTATQNFAPGTSTVGWRVKDGAECTYTDTIDVIVNDVPKVTTLTPDKTICVNQKISLTGTATNAGSVLWSINGPGGLSPLNQYTTEFTPTPVPGVESTTTTVTFTAYGIDPCSYLSDSKSLTITVYQIPDVTITVNVPSQA